MVKPNGNLELRGRWRIARIAAARGQWRRSPVALLFVALLGFLPLGLGQGQAQDQKQPQKQADAERRAKQKTEQEQQKELEKEKQAAAKVEKERLKHLKVTGRVLSQLPVAQIDVVLVGLDAGPRPSTERGRQTIRLPAALRETPARDPQKNRTPHLFSPPIPEKTSPPGIPRLARRRKITTEPKEKIGKLGANTGATALILTIHLKAAVDGVTAGKLPDSRELDFPDPLV